MDILKIFRRRPPIRDTQGLADFIDGNAAFLVQKGIYEYSRARAGHYAKVLFSESGFIEAVEASRWRAYPLGLAMVTEVAEGVLYPHYREDRAAALDALRALVLSAFDRYAVPPALGQEEWANLRAELTRAVQLIGLHPPKRAMDVSETFSESYFGLMPIHEKLRGRDFQTTRNYLRVNLINMHIEFTRRADAPALADGLREQSR